MLPRTVSPSIFVSAFRLGLWPGLQRLRKNLRLQPSGFTLVEVMMGSAILAITVAAVAIILNAAVTTIGRVRVMQTATSLLTERIEQARNLGYTSLGTVGGLPDGVLPATEAVVRNGTTYTITTGVQYVDDPYDGLSPADTTPTDYKRIRVAAGWGGIFASQTPLVIWTDIVPNGLESAVTGGIIEVQVTNALGVAVAGATVHLEAPTATPSVSLDILTDDEGKVILPGAPACSSCYRVSATKSGYTTDRTYGVSEVANPIKPDLTVLTGKTTQVSLAIDIPASVTVRAVRQNYVPFAGVQFTMRGAKLIGHNVMGEPVYKYQQNITTGFGGQTTVNNLEWDTYYVAIPLGSTVDLAGSTPFTPFGLLPGSSNLFIGVVTAASPNSVLVRIKDDNLNPIASASVSLRNDLVTYLATQSTAVQPYPDAGQTYFVNLPSTATPFSLKIESAGMATASTEATVSGDIIQDFIISPL